MSLQLPLMPVLDNKVLSSEQGHGSFNSGQHIPSPYTCQLSTTRAQLSPIFTQAAPC